MRRLLNFIRKQKKGASLIIVIMLMTLLMVLTMGLAAVTSFGVNSSVIQRNYSQAYYAAKSINMSICDAITSKAGLPMVNGWEQEFEEALDEALTDEAQHEKDEEGNIIKITVPFGKLKYSNGSTGNTYYEIDDTGIEIKNKITLEYERKDDLNYKVKNIIVETTAKYDSQVYTLKAQLTNEGYSGGGNGGGTGGGSGGGKYVVGSTGSPNIHKVTYIGGLSSNENIDVQGIRVTGGVYSVKDITIQYNAAEVSGGVYSNSDIILNGVTSEGNIIAGKKITIGSSAGTYNGNLISEKIDIQGQGAIDGNIVSKDKIFIDNSATNVPITGNLISLGFGGIELYTLKLTGNIVAEKGPVKFNNNGTVSGDVIAMGDVSLKHGVTFGGSIISNGKVTFPNGGTVKGDIIAMGDVSLTAVTVEGNVISNGKVTFPNGGTVKGDIIAMSDVSLIGASVERNVISGGNVSFVNGQIKENILSNGSVALGDKANINNITSNGNIKTTAWNASITGEVRTSGTITTADPNLINRITIIHEDDPTFSDYQIQMGVEGGLLYTVNKITQSVNPVKPADKVNEAINTLITSEIQSGINSMGKVAETPSVSWRYDPEPEESKIIRSLPVNKVFDSSEGDLFYEISGNIIIDDSYSIEGNNNVYIKMTGGANQIITFLTNRFDENMAKRLFIISDYDNTVKIHKHDSENNWGNQKATIVNAQIYMPKGKIDFSWTDNITFNGIFIIRSLENAKEDSILFNLISGNYKNTNLEEYLGGSSGGDSSPVIEKGEWSVERFYR